MKNRARLIAWVTFIAGLYFVLDFLVPPTVPLVTVRGAVVQVSPERVTVRTPSGARVSTDLGPGVELIVAGRDSVGNRTGQTVLMREIGPDSRLSMRSRTFVASQDGPMDESGDPVVLRPGEAFYAGEGRVEPQNIQKGSSIAVEARDAIVESVERGSVVLLRQGQRQTVDLARSSVIMRLSRTDDPEEAQLHDLHIGDTVAIGPGTLFADNRDTASRFNSVIDTLALGMGLLSLGMVNGRILRRREKGWLAAVAFFAAVVLGIFTGVYKYAAAGSAERSFSDLVIMRVTTPVGATIFSLLAFYMATAAYRAFRIRTAEAGLMMAAALLVMIGQTPFGTMMSTWLGEERKDWWLPNLAGWILRIPNTALVRALILGIMLGAIATAIRYWLSLERSSAMRVD